MRAFDERDQAAFAALSGDANPLHMDAEAARRLAFDRPLVHGLHGVLRALDHWVAQAGPARRRLRHLSAEFRIPVTVGEPVAFRVNPEATGDKGGAGGARIGGLDPQGRTNVIDPQGRTNVIDPQGRTNVIDPQGRTNVIDPQGRTNELDPQGRTNELDPQGRTEELDPQGRTRTNATGPEARIDVIDPEGQVRMTIRLVAEADSGADSGAAAVLLPVVLPPVPCREREEAGLAGAAGTLPLALDPAALAALAPHVAAALPPAQVAFLLATTRLVGMDCPGLHSVFSGLTLAFGPHDGDGEEADPALHYSVGRYDPRFRFLEMAVAGAGARGTVRALVRARPVAQPTLEEMRALVPAGAFAGRRVLVVGGSRGLGETCAKLFAAGGAEVAITWARGAGDAARVAAETGARTLALDVTDPAPDWAAGLDGWAPTDLCYFATPRIRPTRNRRFSAAAFAALCAVYVDGFLAVMDGLDRAALTRVLYPSSVYVTEAAPRFAEYVAAKAAGEAVCAALAGLAPGVRFSVPRLPRLASDQTSADEPAAAPVLAALLLAAEEETGRPAADRQEKVE